MQNLKDAEQFVRGVWHSYLEESDYSQLESVFDPQVTIIGTGEHEVSRSFGEFKHNIMKERAQRVTTFSILNEWYHLTFLAPELVLVMGEIHARENSQQPLVFENRFRVTMVLRVISRTDGRFCMFINPFRIRSRARVSSFRTE